LQPCSSSTSTNSRTSMTRKATMWATPCCARWRSACRPLRGRPTWSPGKSPSDVLREADTAMYQSKENGRNRVALFRPDMLTHVADRAALRREMDHTLQTDQLQLLVQPQFSRQGEVDGLEL